MKRVRVDFSEAEARAILQAVGNSLTGCSDDERSIVGHPSSIVAAYRAANKIGVALYRNKRKGS